MHDLKQIYNKVFNLLKNRAIEYFAVDGNSKFYPNKPAFSDLGVVCLAITAECVQIDSENLLWSKLKKDYPDWYSSLPHRTRFNHRRKKLADIITNCSIILAQDLMTSDQDLIIDTIPIPVCHMAREQRTLVCQGGNDQIKAAKGWHASSKQWFIGYKMHLITTETGVFVDMIVTPANVHDNFYLKTLDENASFLINKRLLGDRAYIGQAIQLNLFEKLDLELVIPYRRNQHDFKEYPFELKIKRKTIETVFSQYCDEFNIKRNYAKSFDGLFVRLVTKIAAKTFKQSWNQFTGNPVNQTKHALAA